MNKKRILLLSLILSLVAALVIGIYVIFVKQDKKTTLTIVEKQWIENNKNDVIDLSIINNIPIFTYNGEGLVFDYLDSLETNTGLNFNKLSFDKDATPTSDYAFTIKNQVEDNDVLVYEDNYVIISKTNKKFNNLDKISPMTIGVVKDDLNNVSYYLGKNKNLSFKSYASVANLLVAANSNEVNAIVLPKTMYLKEIVENDKLTISYNITEMKKYLVLHLGDNKKLNRILKKYYKKWSRDSYDVSFNDHFAKDYFEFKQIYEQEKANFRSKRYSYGFVESAPYDSLVNNQLVGINDEIIKQFAKMSDIEISYQRYKNNEELVKAFNENKIDFYANASSINDFKMDVSNTVELYDNPVVVLSESNDIIINSEMSLDNYEVATIKDSKIENYLKNNKIDTKTYNNIKELLRKKHKTDLLVIDKATYDLYMHSQLKKYKILYIMNIDNSYTFTSRSISSNKVFNEFLSFFISYKNTNDFTKDIKTSMFQESIKSNKNLIIIIVILILVVIASTIVLIKKLMPKKPKISISKEDKLKYIDMLTSLKNRNFLNDSIEKWDNSGIYPQAIIVVDLNNIAYINDNYGHEEGDNIIREAASILIQTQVEKSEIIRTNGNEFLIYLVEYNEKQVVSYIRKLNKEFKELKHGFGAALGYSIINDELKTVDDAINEATLDMRTNKEETQN